MIDILGYSENQDAISSQIVNYVNLNLIEIVQIAIDHIQDSGGIITIEDFVPRNYYIKKPIECQNLIYELKELLVSKSVREYIKPKYEYLLYSILQWWEDGFDHDGDLLPIELDAVLKNEISNSLYADSIEMITDFKAYYDICFQDWDFLPLSLNEYVKLYIEGKSAIVEDFFHVNLDDYIDLMPADLQELYIQERDKSKYNSDNHEHYVEDFIVKELINVLTDFEKRVVEIKGRGEVEISNDIYSNIRRVLENKGIIIARETTLGRADIKLGETDFYLYHYVDGARIDLSVIENKNVEDFERQYKQLLGYLNKNFEFGVTLSINRSSPFNETIENIEKSLKGKLSKLETEHGMFEIIDVFKSTKSPFFLKSTHILPEVKTQKMSIYHLLLNLYDSEREDIAKQARRKRHPIKSK